MSREIKFRAFDKNGEGMFYEIQKGIDFDDGSQYTFEKFMYPPHDDIHDWVLMQFTNMHDKNGKEIYEGDIVLEGITRKVILWRDASFHVEVPNWKPHADMPTRPLWMDTLSPEGIQFEVIGNVHQNPELLQ